MGRVGAYADAPKESAQAVRGRVVTANEAVREHFRLIGRMTRCLDELPAQLTAQEFLYEVFGCWYIIIERGGKYFRFDFDGKDRLLVASSILRSGEPDSRAHPQKREMPLRWGLAEETFDAVYSFVVEFTEGATK